MGKESTSIIFLAGLCLVAFMKSHTSLLSAPVIKISFGNEEEQPASHVETGIVKRRLSGNSVDSFRVRPSIILFGDSTTENSFGDPHNNEVGFGSLLAAAYSRRADVLNRGFSGYNTKWAVDRLLNSVFTGPVAATQQIVNTGASQRFLVKKDMPSTLFVTVMFGTSDMAEKGDEAYVNIREYGQNLNTIVEHILNCMGKNTPIVLMTPPPFSAKQFIKGGPTVSPPDSANLKVPRLPGPSSGGAKQIVGMGDSKVPHPADNAMQPTDEGGPNVPHAGSAKQTIGTGGPEVPPPANSVKQLIGTGSPEVPSPPDSAKQSGGKGGLEISSTVPYSNNRARAYGFKVKQVAKEYNLALVDTWQILEGTSGQDNFGPKYLYDGMHPNEEGNRMIYQGIMSALEQRYPEVLPMKDGMGRYGTNGIPLEGELWYRIAQA